MAFTDAEKRRHWTRQAPFMVGLWAAWIAVVLVVHPAEGQAQSAPTIASVEMNCDLEGCSDPVQVETWLDLAGLYPGRTLTDEALTVARSRLLKTSLFESVEFQRRETSAGQVALTVEAVGAVRIRKIEFKGVKPPPFRSDLRKLLLYRQGEAFENQETKRQTQIRSLIGEFEEVGYFGTDVTMEVREVEEESKLVDLVFRVDKGKQLEICDIGFRGVRVFSHSEARRELLSDLPLFQSRIELAAPRYTTDSYQAGLEALIQAYRQRGYFQARVVQESVDRNMQEGCVRILVDVDEGPEWSLSFQGNDAVDDEALRQEMPFYESGYVDPEELARAERAIEQLYQTRGYPFAQATAREVRTDRLDRELIFEIDEGKRFEIAEVAIHGNKAIGDGALKEGLGTRAYALFERGGFLQTAQLLGDIRTIEQRYTERGYLRAEVRRYELRVDQKAGELEVHLYIDEGTRTVAQDVRFQGVRSLSRPRLEKTVNVRAGDAFVPVQIRADDSRIVQLYSSVGYPMADVETSCQTLGGEDVACRGPRRPSQCVANSVEAIAERCQWNESGRRKRCTRVQTDDGCGFAEGIEMAESVRVSHRIDEGPFVSAGEILIQGNFRTKDRVIRRELPLESGDIFDVREILRGQSNLRSLGIFNSVSIEAIGLDEAAAKTREHEAALLVSVEESRNRFLEFKVGLEGRDLLSDQRKLLTTAELEYNDRNVGGRALQLSPHVFTAVDLLDVSRLAQSGAGGLRPALDYLVGAELVFRHPRFLKGLTGVDKLFLTVTPFYLIDLLGVVNDQLVREEWGVRLEVRKDLSELVDRLYVSLGFEGKQAATAPINGPRIDGERIFSPRRTTGTLIPELTLDRRNSPLNPTKGFFLKFTPEYVTGDALSAEISTFEDSYFRLTFKGDFFIPLSERLTLGQSIRFGQIVPVASRPTRVPADERYFLGGAGSLRGFPNNSLGPTLDNQPTGGEFVLNYNLEIRYPLIPGANIQGATFFDAGLLVDCFDDETGQQRINCYEDAFGDGQALRNIRTSAGLGIRYVIGGQIPLLFDWGIALDREQGEGFGNLHFHLGYTF
jgi:outer membrane protein insertion porin family